MGMPFSHILTNILLPLMISVLIGVNSVVITVPFQLKVLDISLQYFLFLSQLDCLLDVLVLSSLCILDSTLLWDLELSILFSKFV